ncbi:MAG: UDP-glucose--hexose-1-phosphate uridylyltransferase [Acidobacteria bacterium]|nr:UDP-glucose--hexose-1-phosphate uridylyltransferase [Acidobacteriota bacterium]
MLDWKQQPHRRLNPLTGEWVLVSPQRTLRPWQGKKEKRSPKEGPRHDPKCYLCPGNPRAEGARNPNYAHTFVFDNDYPALVPEASPGEIDKGGLIVAQSESGICRVVCFSPRHDLAIARMQQAQVRLLVDVWVEQHRDLAQRPAINHVQIFENRGALMGCSNPHPHGQIWANATIPDPTRKETESFENHLKARGSCLLCHYLDLETSEGERLIFQNNGFTVLVPYWAAWPFETLVLSRRHIADLDQLSDSERDDLADVLRRLTIRYDGLFQTPFPYSMGFHQQPTDGAAYPGWHLHLHFYPPLLRSATVKKFMVGYEMLASPQRDITPEAAAEKLRAVADGVARET